MNVKIRTEAAQFPEKDYINGIFVAVCSLSLVHPWERLKPIRWITGVKIKQGYPGGFAKDALWFRVVWICLTVGPDSSSRWVGGILLYRLLTVPQPTKNTGFGLFTLLSRWLSYWSNIHSPPTSSRLNQIQRRQGISRIHPVIFNLWILS